MSRLAIFVTIVSCLSPAARAGGIQTPADQPTTPDPSNVPVSEIIHPGLLAPHGVAVESAGNVYVTGRPSDNTFQITPGGVISEIIGSVGDGSGNLLDRPVGITVDSAGNVYVTGSDSDNAFKITPGGAISEIIDSSGDGSGNLLDRPVGITVDSAGNVYVSGFGSDNAFKITPGGVITEIIDATGDGSGNILNAPWGIAVDSSGNVYVTGFDTDNAFKITPGGAITEIIDSAGDGSGNLLKGCFGIAVDSTGNVYVTGLGSHNAFQITAGGMIIQIIDTTGDGSGNLLNGSLAIAVDSAGNVYVTGQWSDNAFKITPGGAISEIIDSAGDGSGNLLERARAIAVDSAGNLYVTGFFSDNAFKITPGGAISEIIDFIGDGSRNLLDGPEAIAVDSAGIVYVAGFLSDNAFRIEECVVNKVCGDGVVGCDEECDDFNTVGGDGCSAGCTIEPGYACIGRPSRCGLDCNMNGVPDGDDISNMTSADCNENGIPDECDIADGTSNDLNLNGVPDECEILDPDVRVFWVTQNSDPASFASGTTVIDVLQGGARVCMEIFIQSVTGSDVLSSGGEIIVEDGATFSGGGSLEADCSTTAIDRTHPFDCAAWKTWLIFRENCGTSGSMDRVRFVRLFGPHIFVPCLIPTTGGIYFAELCFDVSADALGSATINYLVLNIADADGFLLDISASTPLTIRVFECLQDADCNDNDVCTFDRCVGGVCTHTPGRYGDLDHDGDIDLFDLFCLANSFSGDFSVCSFAEIDIEPCPGDGDIDVFDIFAVVNAFSGVDPCCGGLP